VSLALAFSRSVCCYLFSSRLRGIFYVWFVSPSLKRFYFSLVFDRRYAYE